MRNGTDFPTGLDCFIRINGQKVATVESYDISRNKNVRIHHSMGQREATGFSEGAYEYNISISRAYMDDGPNATTFSFFDLPDFELVIVKPGMKEIFTPCRISTDDERADVSDRVMENATILALTRRVERG